MCSTTYKKIFTISIKNYFEYNEQKKISTPLVSNYTNIELARKQHETLNVYPSGGIRQQIDDFVSRIGNKKYSTIEGSNYNNYQYDNN